MWSDWSPCNVECGSGEQTREREVIEALFGGIVCEGDRADVRECMAKKKCKGKTIVSIFKICFYDEKSKFKCCSKEPGSSGQG
jgi:hypothetical protein